MDRIFLILFILSILFDYILDGRDFIKTKLLALFPVDRSVGLFGERGCVVAAVSGWGTAWCAQRRVARMDLDNGRALYRRRACVVDVIPGLF